MRRLIVLGTSAIVLAACSASTDPGAVSTPTAPADRDTATDGDDQDVPAPDPSAVETPTPTDTATEAAPSQSPSPSATESDPPASPTPSGSAPAAADGAPVAAPPGTYEYATDGESQTADQEPRSMPETTLLVVSEPYNGAKQDRRRDMRDEDGVGSVTTTFFQHAGDGTYLTGLLLETTVEVFGSQFTDTRDLVAMPPALIAPPDLEPGDVATFHLEGDEMQADGTMTFVARETLQVDGTEVDTNVIDVDVTFSGSVEGSSDSTWWVRPQDLLLVREIAESEGRQGTVTFTSSHTSMLLSLQAR